MGVKYHLLEKKQRFSDSILWKLQSEAYSQFGPEAWTGKGVPSYLTSNPYTAKQYAKVVLGYVRDCLRNGSIDIAHPVYLFDLGAGTGRFGFLFLKELLAALQLLWDSRVHIRYVMTDIVESNLAFCQQHSYLQTYIKQGILDFAYYYHGMTPEEPIKLIRSQKILLPEAVYNPLILIANYFFDTIPQDLFRIKDGKLEEGLVTIAVKSTKEADELDPSDPSLIEFLDCRYDYIPLDNLRYYSGDVENEILAEYLNQFDNAVFLFPKGAFLSLHYFSMLSRNRLLLVAGDQGVCTTDQVKAWGEPKIARHGSFSCPVSYHAISMYFQQLHGAGLLTTFSDPLFVVMAGILGGKKEEYPELLLAFQETFDYFEPQDYWCLVSAIERQLERFSLSDLLKIIRLGNWDPINFNVFFEAIRQRLLDASPSTKKDLVTVINHVWEHFYPVSSEESGFILNLGVLMYEMKYYEEALLFFERSLTLSGENAIALKNMSACYIALHNKVAALDCLRRAKNAEAF